MKRLSYIFTKSLSFLLVMSMLCGTASAIQISGTAKASDEASTVYFSDSVRIDGYTDQEGNSILCEYTDGVLTQRNTIFTGNDSYYQREIFGENPICEFIYIDDYISVETSMTPYSQTQSTTLHGNIQFKTMSTYGYIYNKLNVDCTVSNFGITKYTVNEFVGPIVDLVSIVALALLGSSPVGVSIAALTPQFVSIITNVAIGCGALVVGNEIKSKLTCELIGNRTDYNWSVANSDIPDEKKTLSGLELVINDGNHPGRTGEIVSDGYIPNKHWRTNSFAVTCHNMIFGYAPDAIIGWSPLG